MKMDKTQRKENESVLCQTARSRIALTATQRAAEAHRTNVAHAAAQVDAATGP